MAEAGENPEREQRILDAAARLFTHYGFDKTTVSDIAAEAGISKGAVYLHFKSKDDLFEALIYREGERLLDDIVARVEADSEAGGLFSLYQHTILAVIRNPLMHALMTRDSRILGDFTRRWSKTHVAQEGSMFRLEMVKQFQAANVIRADLDAEIITYVLALIRYGFLTIGEVIPPEQAPPLDVVGKTMGMLLERALAPETGYDPEAGKRALMSILAMMRELVRQQKAQRPQ
jgi:TetR/AcrR family acrAB operon transcriptional repressor